MRRLRPVLLATTAVFAGAAIAAPAAASSASPSSSSSARGPLASLHGRGHRTHRGSNGEVDVNVCSDTVPAGLAHCEAHVRTDVLGRGLRPRPSQPGARSNDMLGNNGAYDPAYLQSAYNAPSATNGAGQTVAVVDAFDSPNVENDLATYRQLFGLPPCTTQNGCFRKVDEHGGTNYPAFDAGWAEEISLDVDMVSAICPLCHILLVEGAASTINDLAVGVNTAVALGANAVSNSYAASEFSGERTFDPSYNHPGVAIVASSGDSGFGVSYPAVSPGVVSVGGTSLLQATNTGTRDATETVWSGAGSGCSTVESKPAWQTNSGCAHRTVADVSAVADPYTGVWVYDSADGGWEIFGGTSVSSPIIGAFYALAGNGASSASAQLGAYPWAHPGSLNDVVSGSNGSCGTSLCNGAIGYDGPTGLGTPNTAAAFAPDFTLTASGVQGVVPGGSAKSTVTVTPLNGFKGTVRLTAAVSPSTGLSTSLSAGSLAITTGPRTSTLTLTGHTGGTYTVAVTAAVGTSLHTASITVVVNDFTVALSPAKTTVTRGQQAQLTVTLAGIGAFNSPITLSVSGLPALDTVALSQNPASAPGVVTLTITTYAAYAPGSLTVHVQGASGTLKHVVSATLVVVK